jgi:hypothetical protein
MIQCVLTADSTRQEGESVPTKVKLSEHRCALCGRRLPQEQWVYSRHTDQRYCLEGQCKTDRKGKA